MKQKLLKQTVIISIILLVLLTACCRSNKAIPYEAEIQIEETAECQSSILETADDEASADNENFRRWVAPAKVDAGTYRVRINVTTQRVNIFGRDENGEHTIPVKQFICSTGLENTPSPLGTFVSSDKFRWATFRFSPALGAVTYGQYNTRITGPFLIHSMVYGEYGNPASMLWEQYNRLGNRASAGCIRVNWAAAKWIYVNCPPGTIFDIYEGEDNMPVALRAAPLEPVPPGTKYDPSDYEYIRTIRR